MAGQLWATSSLGGYFYSDRLSNKLRTAVQPLSKFRQFCDITDDVLTQKKRGDTFKWDCVFNVTTAGTTLTETNTIPETNFKILQASATVTEYGNSIPWTGKLESLSQFAVRRPVMEALKNDTAKVLDSAAYAEFNKTPLRVVAEADSSACTLTTNSTATQTNTIGLRRGHVRTLHDLMSERAIPYYDDEAYVFIARPTTFTGLKQDMEAVFQYVPEGYRKIINGEIGKFENVRFVGQTNIGTASWAQSKSDDGFIFGAETVCEGMVEPESIRAKTPEDYGRSMGLAWYYLGGFGIFHNWSTTIDTGAANARIIKWASAA